MERRDGERRALPSTWAPVAVVEPTERPRSRPWAWDWVSMWRSRGEAGEVIAKSCTFVVDGDVAMARAGGGESAFRCAKKGSGS
jgi:hypothetical protein